MNRGATRGAALPRQSPRGADSPAPAPGGAAGDPLPAGVRVYPDFLGAAACAELEDRIAAAGPVTGPRRGLARGSPWIGGWLRRHRVTDLASRLCGGRAALVSATLFAKGPGRNWVVPPHQDVAMAVRDHAPEAGATAGFSGWSIKRGIPHVLVPEPVSRRAVALRISLDDCPADAGVLRVLPGSQRRGRWPDARLRAVATRDLVPVATRRGDLVAMRPLLVHASARARRPRPRRVLHVVFCAADPPAGLAWVGAAYPAAGT